MPMKDRYCKHFIKNILIKKAFMHLIFILKPNLFFFVHLLYYGRALSSISEGVTRLARAGRMTCKVRRDFKIITDVLSRVSLVTLNIRGSSICSPKSLYKKTSNEILAELKAVVKTGTLKVPRSQPVLPQSATTYLSGMCQIASSHPHPITTERKEEEGRN